MNTPAANSATSSIHHDRVRDGSKLRIDDDREGEEGETGAKQRGEPGIAHHFASVPGNDAERGEGDAHHQEVIEVVDARRRPPAEVAVHRVAEVDVQVEGFVEAEVEGAEPGNEREA